MNEILHANIFFFIASLATVCFLVFVGIIFFYVIKIMKLVRSILEKIEAGSEIIAEDAAKLRSIIASGGIFSKIFSFFMGQAMSGKTRRRRKVEKIINDEQD